MLLVRELVVTGLGLLLSFVVAEVMLAHTCQGFSSLARRIGHNFIPLAFNDPVTYWQSRAAACCFVPPS